MIANRESVVLRCGIVLAALAVLGAASAVRAQDKPAPAGAAAIRAYGCDVHDSADTDAGAPAGVSIVAARNGTFSGKVVAVGGAIAKATVSDLKLTPAGAGSAAGAPAVIPASAIRITYAGPGGNRGPSHIRPSGLDLLVESPPADPPSGKTPVWVTVKVPKDAQAGLYTGQLTLGSVSVPVKLDVRDWTLPDPQNYRTWVELVQSPDTLAVEYDVPLWSEKHWDLVAKSMRFIADTGSRVICIPLIARTNFGNAESMVRWIKKGPNQYEYDFSILEKYLDVVEKNLGKPKITQVWAWECYLLPIKGAPAPIEIKSAEGSYEYARDTATNAKIAAAGKGPPVTVVDPATGKTETLYLPRYEDANGNAKALWKPVWEGVRSRLAKRGWDKTMMVGNTSDIWPSKEEVAVLSDLSGGLPWTSCSHNLNVIKSGVSLGKLQGITDFGYAATALEWQHNFDPAKGGHHYGWKLPELNAQYWRFQAFNAGGGYNSYVFIRHTAETLVTANKRGVGHVGADFWPCVKDKKGVPSGTVTDRFPESYWRSLHIGAWLLGPGPGGPVSTPRMEVFRDGIEECEARIAIEVALSDESLKAKLGADLAKRAGDYLDARLVSIWKGYGLAQADLDLGYMTHYRQWYEGIGKRSDPAAGLKWYMASGWQDRAAKIFDLAGEVERKLAGGK